MKTVTMKTDTPIDYESMEKGKEVSVSGEIIEVRLGCSEPKEPVHVFEGECTYDDESNAWVEEEGGHAVVVKEYTGEVLEEGKKYRITIEEIEEE